VVACAGCAQVTEPPIGDPIVFGAGDDTLGFTVNGPDYQMEFQGGGITQVHMPERLLVEGIDILGRSMNTCNFENLIGLAVHPALVGSAITQATVVDSYLSTLGANPFVIQLEAGYTLGYSCPNATQLVTRSIFTFLPNGRIHRADEITPTTTTLTSPSTGSQSCGCGTLAAGMGFTFTSYWAFDRTPPHSNVDVDGNALDRMANNLMAEGACTIYNDRAVAVEFESPTTRVEPNDTVAHVRDIARMPMLPADQTVTLLSRIKITGADGLQAGQCGELLAQLLDPPLVVDGVPTGANPDGIYIVPGEHSSTFTIRNDTDTPVPPNFTMSIDIGEPGHLVASGPSVTSDFGVRSFRQDDGRYMLVFRDPLPPGAQITVEPF